MRGHPVGPRQTQSQGLIGSTKSARVPRGSKANTVSISYWAKRRYGMGNNRARSVISRRSAAERGYDTERTFIPHTILTLSPITNLSYH